MIRNKVQKVWDFIFRNDPSLQKIPLYIAQKTVKGDTILQKIFIQQFLSYEKRK